MALPPVGIQPIIFGQRNQTDPTGVLDEIAEADFNGVEAPNWAATHGLDTVRRWFCDRGLVVPATHLGYGAIEQLDQLNAAIDWVCAMGGRYVICSGTKDRTPEGYDVSCELFEDAGRRCADRGLRFLYHNHAWEFDVLDDGSRGIDRILMGTDPEWVGLNIDVYWVHLGGDDPVTFIEDNADRAGYFHFKDGGRDEAGKPTFCELGLGTVDLAAAMEATLGVGATWITYEQDRTDRPTATSLRLSRDYLGYLGV